MHRGREMGRGVSLTLSALPRLALSILANGVTALGGARGA